VTVADTTHVSGQIQLRGGVLNLYGKTFDIETGTVTFVGNDASNPQVHVTAGWIASDGTQVKADFIGPLKTGKVTLRSEPPLGRNDIVQLLLFGTTDGEVANATAAAPPGAYSAGGVAGNIATQPLNRALDQFGLSAVSAKVDTTAADAKPTVEVQIAKTLSLELAHVLYLGPPPPGTAPDTTLVTLDWRFLKKWSLLATVGNAGSTIVDMVWQYRY
jgi:translocation and assembly module TamB